MKRLYVVQCTDSVRTWFHYFTVGRKQAAIELSASYQRAEPQLVEVDDRMFRQMEPDTRISSLGFIAPHKMH